MKEALFVFLFSFLLVHLFACSCWFFWKKRANDLLFEEYSFAADAIGYIFATLVIRNGVLYSSWLAEGGVAEDDDDDSSWRLRIIVFSISLCAFARCGAKEYICVVCSMVWIGGEPQSSEGFERSHPFEVAQRHRGGRTGADFAIVCHAR